MHSLLNWTTEISTSTRAIIAVFIITSEIWVLQFFLYYPNPSNGDITISFNNPNQEKVQVSLYDMRGRLINVRNFENTNTTFNEDIQFSSLEQAIYILKVKTGSTEITKRLLIK